jgi:hypothetical protein
MNIETLFEQTELGQVIKKAIEEHIKGIEKAKAKEDKDIWCSCLV